MHALLWWLVAVGPLAAGVQEPAAVVHFVNRNQTFALDLPAGWRQMSPDETRRLREVLPADLHRTEPRSYYAVGPVDRWLQEGFDGVHLLVVEQSDEWVLGDDFAAALRREWQRLGAEGGVRHEISEVRRRSVGPESHEVIECFRRTVAADGSAAMRSLDVYAPTGGRQVLLAFRCRESDFPDRLPAFRSWIDTLTFARKPRGEASLADRLWTPVITGVLVGLLLALLYRLNRRRV